MKTTFCLFVFLFLNFVGLAQESRYETITGTNSITIADYETGELISVLSTNVIALSAYPSPYSTSISVEKNGLTFQLHAAASQFSKDNTPMALSGNGVQPSSGGLPGSDCLSSLYYQKNSAHGAN